MNYDNKSDYALNKDTEDIVYLFADGQEVRYRKENGKVYKVVDSTDITEVPLWEMSVEEFDRVKAISNADYHERELHSKRTTRDNVSINKLIETNCVSGKSAEQEYFDYLEALDAPTETRTLKHAMAILDECLTETQRQRYIQHHYIGLTIREIADKEGTHFTTVHESLQTAEKKIKKYFKNS